MKTSKALVLAVSILSLSTAASAEPKVEVRMQEDVAASTGNGVSHGGGDDYDLIGNACPYVRGELVKLGYSAAGSVANPFTIYSAGNALSCLTVLKNSIANSPLVKAYKHSGYADDTWAYVFAKLFFPQVSSVDLGNNPEADTVRTTVSPKGAICYRSSFYHAHDGLPEECSRGTVFMDDSCNVVQPTLVADACGGHANKAFELDFLRSSPISFLWESSVNIEESASVVSFPIDPTFRNAWYTWKASDKAPLLVHDPAHDGIIKTGTQLFGPWAFGGKRTSMNSENGILGTPWRDGFEALGSLDADADGVLSGGELEPLALWFDTNQDAKSQPGEVKSLGDAGVTKVYYHSNRIDGTTGSIFADVGFERVVHGRTVRGASVDWFADTAATPGELVGKHVLRTIIPGNSDSAGLSDTTPELAAPSEVRPGTAAKPTVKDPLVGMWQWSFSEQAEAGIQGYLLLGVDTRGQKVRGYSLVGNRFAYTPNDVAKEVVNFFGVVGNYTTAENGKRTVKLESKLGGTTMRTEAEMSVDGKMLEAVTTAYVNDGGRYHKLTYRWNALKVN